MIKQFMNTSTWREDDITVKAYETVTVPFLETTPNNFVIQNANNSELKIGISKMPTEDNYEFKVNKNTMEPISRPVGTKYLYIYNDSIVDANIKIFSVNAPFDLSVLKNMHVSVENMDVSVDDFIIGGFEKGVSLPPGSNKIGYVEIEQNNDVPVALNSAQEQFLSGIDTSNKEVKNLLSAIQNRLSWLTSANTIDGNITLLTLNKTLYGLHTLLTNSNTLLAKIGNVSPDDVSIGEVHYPTNTASIFSYVNNTDTVKRIHFDYFMNDNVTNRSICKTGTGEYKIYSFGIYDYVVEPELLPSCIDNNGLEDIFTIYPGEQFFDLEFEIPPGSTFVYLALNHFDIDFTNGNYHDGLRRYRYYIY